jgi:hypothetical protein
MIEMITPEIDARAFTRLALKPQSFSVAQSLRNPLCYSCSQPLAALPKDQRTRDHLPPQNLFFEPLPGNLITAPCCERCHTGHSQDDEYLRLAVCGQYNTTELGKRMWKEKVLGSTVRNGRIHERVRAMNASLRPIALITPDGIKDAVEGEIDGAAVERELIRMTKGLLSLLYPEVNRAELAFDVMQGDLFKVNHPAFAWSSPAFSKFERGDGVYQCWHCVESYSHFGLWIHMFFGSSWYFTEHRSDLKMVLPC